MEHAEEVFDAALHLLSATPVFTCGVMIYFCPTEVKLQSRQHFKQQHFMGESACFSVISEFNLLFTCLSSHLAVLLTDTPRLHPTPPVCTVMSEWGKPDLVWTTISSDHIWSQFHALKINTHTTGRRFLHQRKKECPVEHLPNLQERPNNKEFDKDSVLQRL